jgi:hypothetical protein
VSKKCSSENFADAGETSTSSRMYFSHARIAWLRVSQTCRDGSDEGICAHPVDDETARAQG